jgi:MFS transporter, FSR family, fosmidomycin resistance protein
MTDTPHPIPVTLAAAQVSDTRVIATVSAAHFVSHYYTLLLAPLFAFVRADYGVSYTELGFALAAYNLVSGTLQTPAGFLVDRIGARSVLVAGLVIGASAFAVVGMVDSFPVLVAMFALAGIGNTVYHPADYTILSQQVRPKRAAHAFSIHTFAGMLGSAVAPTTLLLLYGVVGWRGAFIAAAILGLAVAGIVAMQRDAPPAQTPAKPNDASAGEAAGSRSLLLSPVILLNLAYFALLSFASAGLQNFTVVGLEALFGTPVAASGAALTAYLFMTALGVLAGGFAASRLTHHALPVIVGMTAMGAGALAIGLVSFGIVALVLVMSLAGFLAGAAMPSRDMIVRAATPEGSFGKVFGFVSTGMNLAWAAGPIVFGQLMDRGHPQAVFLVVAATCLLSIPTVLFANRRPH